MLLEIVFSAKGQESDQISDYYTIYN